MSEGTRPPGITLRVTDQETARVVAIHRFDGHIVGAGCLLDANRILTCRHVVLSALKASEVPEGQSLQVTLAGVNPPTEFEAIVEKVDRTDGPQNDLAMLVIRGGSGLNIRAADFASPIRHNGKSYSVLGFPGGDPQGQNASGKLHAANATGLVQMDRVGSILVQGGFSGAPVWSSDVNAFVGIVVAERTNHQVAWCIPSRRISEFFPELRVRFRIPEADRPVINDWDVDDPNVDFFGCQSEVRGRRLTAKVIRPGKHGRKFQVNAVYEITGKPVPRGKLVTFITYPDFKRARVDAYELFSELIDGKAEQEFYPDEFFTVAAIGDAGETALTLNLEDLKIWPKPSRLKKAKGKQPKKS